VKHVSASYSCSCSYSNRVKRLLENKENELNELAELIESERTGSSSSGERGDCCGLAFNAGRMEKRADFVCENCGRAFFRGLFLACGSISDPEIGYHLEFALADSDNPNNSSKPLAAEIRQSLSGENIFLKSVKRRKKHVLYLKSSEQIEDFLYYINAEKFSFELMQTKILKSVRNDANRSRNFESANLDKMSRASAEQLAAIESLKSSGKFESLPKELKQTAEIRLENIEMSLQEIGEASNPAVTKSAIVHRMKKIMKIANSE